MRHMTRDMGHVTHGLEWPFSLNFSFLVLMFFKRHCFEVIFTKDDLYSMNSLMTKVFFRTAPATPGLLKRGYLSFDK